jgi:hypothetical protein
MRQRAFTGTVWAHDGMDFSRFNLKVDAFEDLLVVYVDG